MTGFWYGARRRALAFCLAWLLLPGVTPINASEPYVVRVEEDWQLLMAEPDANSTAPQVTCTIAPGGSSDVYAAFELNHRTQPEFSPGGLQLQVWDDEMVLCSHEDPSTNVMSTVAELVTWTQVLDVTTGQLRVEITQGLSTTWGVFGGAGHLRADLPITMTNLDQYDPNESVANSGVGYALNRVDTLVLTRVRVHLSDGLVIEDSTPRVAVAPSN